MFWFIFITTLSEVSGAWTLQPQQKGVWLVDHKAHSSALACLGHGMAGCTGPSAFLLLSCLNACSGAPKQLPLFWHASVLLKDPKCLSELSAWLWLWRSSSTSLIWWKCIGDPPGSICLLLVLSCWVSNVSQAFLKEVSSFVLYLKSQVLCSLYCSLGSVNL